MIKDALKFPFLSMFPMNKSYPTTLLFSIKVFFGHSVSTGLPTFLSFIGNDGKSVITSIGQIEIGSNVDNQKQILSF
jgi:hypothetical protein